MPEILAGVIGAVAVVLASCIGPVLAYRLAVARESRTGGDIRDRGELDAIRRPGAYSSRRANVVLCMKTSGLGLFGLGIARIAAVFSTASVPFFDADYWMAALALILGIFLYVAGVELRQTATEEWLERRLAEGLVVVTEK